MNKVLLIIICIALFVVLSVLGSVIYNAVNPPIYCKNSKYYNEDTCNQLGKNMSTDPQNSDINCKLNPGSYFFRGKDTQDYFEKGCCNCRSVPPTPPPPPPPPPPQTCDGYKYKCPEQKKPGTPTCKEQCDDLDCCQDQKAPHGGQCCGPGNCSNLSYYWCGGDGALDRVNGDDCPSKRSGDTTSCPLPMPCVWVPDKDKIECAQPPDVPVWKLFVGSWSVRYQPDPYQPANCPTKVIFSLQRTNMRVDGFEIWTGTFNYGYGYDTLCSAQTYYQNNSGTLEPLEDDIVHFNNNCTNVEGFVWPSGAFDINKDKTELMFKTQICDEYMQIVLYAQ
jgi:hypothetical protein